MEHRCPDDNNEAHLLLSHLLFKQSLCNLQEHVEFFLTPEQSVEEHFKSIQLFDLHSTFVEQEHVLENGLFLHSAVHVLLIQFSSEQSLLFVQVPPF